MKIFEHSDAVHAVESSAIAQSLTKRLKLFSEMEKADLLVADEQAQ